MSCVHIGAIGVRISRYPLYAAVLYGRSTHHPRAPRPRGPHLASGAAAAGGAGQRPHTSHVCVLLRSVRRLVPVHGSHKELLIPRRFDHTR